MLRQFAHKVEEIRRLIGESRSASFLLAVSGGMDSMCLLDLFSKVLQPSEYAVAHCNFSLRGEESDGDQALVEARAAELGARLFVKRFDTVAYARERGVSIEMAARELRYEWFDELCREQGFDVLAVAHNANDNAETLMLNLLRGTGLNGLHGMAEVSGLSTEDGLLVMPKTPAPTIAVRCKGPQDHLSSRSRPLAGGGMSSLSSSSPSGNQIILLYRPLLEFTRKQIEGYVLAHRVPYRHDSSNFESDYKRNKIRNEVFPVFEKINPSFVRTLNREIGYFAEAGSIVEDWCREQLPNVLITDSSEGRTVVGQKTGVLAPLRKCPSPVRPSDNVSSVMSSERSESRHLTINTAALLATPHWRYLLYYILQPYGFNSQNLAAIENLLSSDRTISGKRFESQTHMLLTARDSLMIVPSRNGSTTASSSHVSLDGSSAVSAQRINRCTDAASDGKTALHEDANVDAMSCDGVGGDATSCHCVERKSCHMDDVMVVRGPGIYNFNGRRFIVEVDEWKDGMSLKQPAGTLIFDADKLKFPFVCRRWRQGDWLVPLGMRGKKKVSDLFTDLKFNTTDKESAIILVDTCTDSLAERQHVAALLGLRIDDRYKVTASSHAVIRIAVSDVAID